MNLIDRVLTLFAHLHPLVLHVPIGLVLGLAALELLLRRHDLSRVRTPFALLLALSAVAAVLTGLALGEEHAGGDTFEWHKRTALGFAGACALLALAAWRARTAGTGGSGALRAYRALLALAVLLVLPAGHLGASMTHGEDFVTEPLRALFSVDDESADVAPGVAQVAKGVARVAPGVAQLESGVVQVAPGSVPVAADFEHVIAPILIERCSACHGATRQRARLALHTPEALALGGRHGPVFVAGDPVRSELLRRLRLPHDDEDHMPPENKPQPDTREIAALAAWITAGAPFTGAVAGLAEFGDLASAAAERASAAAPTSGAGDDAAVPPAVRAVPAEPAPADAAALDALRSALVHVQTVAAGSPLLWVDFAAVAAQTTDADAAALLGPVREQVAEVSLARCDVGDSLLPLLAQMPRLTRLDLHGTRLTTAGLSALSGHAALVDLVLARTQLDAGAVEVLLSLPSLRRVYLWQAGLDEPALSHLREARPELDVDAGETGASTALETEAPVTLVPRTQVGPPPAAAVAGAPVSLAPVNSACPISGRALDPAFLIVDQGRVIGFCCRDCLATFLADPGNHRAAVK